MSNACLASGVIRLAMTFLRSQLNDYIKLRTGTPDDAVQFIASEPAESAQFPLNVVTPLLINVEEDRTNRMVMDRRGTGRTPEIDINLMVLFVCRFNDYEQGLSFLSLVVQFFQTTPVFDRQQYPSLGTVPNAKGGQSSFSLIQKLTVELTTMPLAEQNEVWSALRTSYLPSVLYKVRMLTYQDHSLQIKGPDVQSVNLDLNPTQGGSAQP